MSKILLLKPNTGTGTVLLPLMPDRLETLISAEAIRVRISELALEIDLQYQGESVLLVAVLKGSVHFLSDLSRAMTTETSLDFMQVSSYQSGKSSTGVVQIVKDLDINIEGKHLLIVEDIVDTGRTLSYLRRLLTTRNPKSVSVVALLSKPDARVEETPVEYVGFVIPNEFVVGYGLDYAERYRNLPFVARLIEEA